MRILIVGRGYIGTAFRDECARRGKDFRVESHKAWRMSIVEFGPEVVINAAAFIPLSGRVDDCKDHLHETMDGNLVLPMQMASWCDSRGIIMAHISTGCLYDEAKEYTEDDAPTRDWNGYAGCYVGTKLVAERYVQHDCQRSYIWRIRLPFDEVESPRNYLSKLKSFNEVWDQTNSLTHRGDFVKSALDMIEKRVPFGVYNMVNSGTASAAWLAEYIQMKTGHPMLSREVTKGPVPGCKLSTAKLEATGCGMRPVSEAVAEALKEWRTA